MLWAHARWVVRIKSERGLLMYPWGERRYMRLDLPGGTVKLKPKAKELINYFGESVGDKLQLFVNEARQVALANWAATMYDQGNLYCAAQRSVYDLFERTHVPGILLVNHVGNRLAFPLAHGVFQDDLSRPTLYIVFVYDIWLDSEQAAMFDPAVQEYRLYWVQAEQLADGQWGSIEIPAYYQQIGI
jgi:hypothetical protein